MLCQRGGTLCPSAQGLSGPRHCPKGIWGGESHSGAWRATPMAGTWRTGARTVQNLPVCPGEVPEERRSSPPSFGAHGESWGGGSGTSKGVLMPHFPQRTQTLVLGPLEASTVIVGAPSGPTLSPRGILLLCPLPHCSGPQPPGAALPQPGIFP